MNPTAGSNSRARVHAHLDKLAANARPYLENMTSFYGEPCTVDEFIATAQRWAKVLKKVDDCRVQLTRAIRAADAAMPEIDIFIRASHLQSKIMLGPQSPELPFLGFAADKQKGRPKGSHNLLQLIHRDAALQAWAELKAELKALRKRKDGTITIDSATGKVTVVEDPPKPDPKGDGSGSKG